jgi:hypothetical protein
LAENIREGLLSGIGKTVYSNIYRRFKNGYSCYPVNPGFPEKRWKGWTHSFVVVKRSADKGHEGDLFLEGHSSQIVLVSQ